MLQRLSSTLLLLIAVAPVHASGAGNPASRPYVDEEVDKTTASLKQYVRDYIASTITYTIGDNVQGGVVFWVDETGEHGLVAALADVENPLLSPALTDAFTPPAGGGSGSGYINTAIIMSVVSTLGISLDGQPVQQYTSVARDASRLITNNTGQPNIAACDGRGTPSVDEACYNGWYVPSQGEMQLMIAGLCNIDASKILAYTALRTDIDYWTSNINYSGGDAVAISYTQTGTQPNASCSGSVSNIDITLSRPVRPVRQF